MLDMINEQSNVEAAILHAIPECMYDPDKWSMFAWDWGHGELSEEDGPRDWQRGINQTIRNHLSNPETRYQPCRIAVSSGHGIGKSAQMGMLSNWAMSCFSECRITTTANTELQLRTKTVPEITRWYRRSITNHWFDYNATSIKLRDKAYNDTWRQDFTPWSEHNTEAFAGLHNKDKIIILMFDEASRIADKVWETADGALTDENTIIIWLVFGNPTRATGRFRECFRRFRHRWYNIKIDSRTVPGTNKRLLSEWETDYGEDSDFFKIRVRGEFPNLSAMQFIGSDDVTAATKRHLREEQYTFAPPIIGVDPAWTGEDTLEIYLRQGLYSKHLLSLPKNDNDFEVASTIARFEDQYRARMVNIDGGFGTGIYSCGKTMGRNWNLIWFSGKSPDPGYINLRAYMWGEMRDWLKSGGVIDPKDQILQDDLVGLETIPRSDGKQQLEDKQTAKKRGIPSPNRADALGLTFAVKVPSNNDPYDGLGSPHGDGDKSSHDFDPYT